MLRNEQADAPTVNNIKAQIKVLKMSDVSPTTEKPIEPPMETLSPNLNNIPIISYDGPNWEDIMWKSMLAQFGFSVFLDLSTFLSAGVANPTAEHWFFSPYSWMTLLVAVCKSAAILVFGGIAKVYSRYADKKAKKD